MTEQWNDSGQRDAPPKRRYSLDLSIHGDSTHSIADRLYELATELLHVNFAPESSWGGVDSGGRYSLVENDPTMTHDRYVEALAEWRAAAAAPSCPPVSPTEEPDT